MNKIEVLMRSGEVVDFEPDGKYELAKKLVAFLNERFF